MNHPDRNPDASGGNPGSPDARRGRTSSNDFDDDFDDFENFESAPRPSSASRPTAPETDPDEAFFEDKPDVSVESESTRRSSSSNSAGGRAGASAGQSKGFLETLEEGLRSAGQTAQRYGRMGVARAEMEKLRFDLKTAHATLGELAMRCWTDAPDLGLTSQDPAVADVVKKIKQIRLKIREKQAKIAELRKEP